MSEYTINLETGRLELINMSKEMYQGLEKSIKDTVKAYFTFSKFAGCWVSKSTKNHWNAQKIAEKLGFTEGGKKGEELTEEEMRAIKIKKAERRIVKYESYYQNALKRADNLQSEFRSHHGDISYFTQPNINSSKGRAFTRQRERVCNRYRKGVEEFNKAQYFLEKIETAKATLKKLLEEK
jgi:hypothetical protein